jgi:hypothetical protein
LSRRFFFGRAREERAIQRQKATASFIGALSALVHALTPCPFFFGTNFHLRERQNGENDRFFKFQFSVYKIALCRSL